MTNFKIILTLSENKRTLVRRLNFMYIQNNCIYKQMIHKANTRITNYRSDSDEQREYPFICNYDIHI